MKTPFPVLGGVRWLRAIISRSVLFAGLVLAVLTAPSFSGAQTSQSGTAKSAKSSKETKSAQSAKTAGSTKSSEQLPPSPSRFAKRYKGEYGVSSRDEGSDKSGASEDPTAAETEAYQNRAYPAAYVPLQLTINAQNVSKNRFEHS